MTAFQTSIQGSNDDVRRQLYQGTLYLLPATQASLKLTNDVWDLVQREMGIDNAARTAQFRLSERDYFETIGRLRKHIYTEPHFHQLVVEVMESAAFDPVAHAFDPARIRVVAHNGHLNPAAGPQYYGHRDTWYSNPQNMITWWMPLHDVRAEETFVFYPDDFSRVVLNDSECFDFETWVKEGQTRRIGWQDSQTGRTARYPQLMSEPGARTIPVECRAGQILLFSGQHLHQTLPNQTGRTRFSLDFRTVHLADHDCGREAPNVDNRSTGSSLRQMIRGDDVCQARAASPVPAPCQE